MRSDAGSVPGMGRQCAIERRRAWKFRHCPTRRALAQRSARWSTARDSRDRSPYVVQFTVARRTGNYLQWSFGDMLMCVGELLAVVGGFIAC